MMRQTRRSLLTALGGAAIAAASASSAHAFDIISAQYGNSTSGFPYAVGTAKGIFKKHGADVTGILASVGGGNDVRNLVAGNLPYGEVALPSVVTAIQQGADLVIISENVENAASLIWVALPSSPINSVHDLKGKRLGYSNPQSFTQAVEFLLLDKAGYKPGEVTMVSTGGFGPGLIALQRGGVDVTIIPLNDLVAEPTKYKVVIRGQDAVPPIANTVGIASRRTLQRTPDVLRAIIAARREAVDYMKANRAESAAIIGKVYRLDPPLVIKVLELLIDHGLVDGIPYWGPGSFNFPGMQTMIDTGRRAGMITGKVDIRSLIDESVLPPDLRGSAG